MELWLWAVVGGLAGAVLMDFAAIAAEKTKNHEWREVWRIPGYWAFGENFAIGLQYFGEQIQKYSHYIQCLPPGFPLEKNCVIL